LFLPIGCGWIVLPKNLTVSADGEARPIAPNDPEGGRAMNRRVEFIRVERHHTPDFGGASRYVGSCRVFPAAVSKYDLVASDDGRDSHVT